MSLQILSIQTTHTSFSNFSQLSKLRESNTLGAICFVDSTAGDSVTLNNDMPTIQLHTPILDGLDTACEVWTLSTSKTPVTGSFESIKYRINDEFLFGVITLPDSLLLKNKNNAPELQLITESAYRQIFALMDEMDYAHIYRFWNYMADINGVSHGLERYRQFNIGRKNAFLTSSNITNSQLPAACALGTANGPLSIAFLLGRKAPVAIENPRQVSAYEYPEDYGPKTPSFSRATLLRLEHSAILFISGTARIIPNEITSALMPPAIIVSIIARGTLVLASCTSSARSPHDSCPKKIQIPIRLAAIKAPVRLPSPAPKLSKITLIGCRCTKSSM